MIYKKDANFPYPLLTNNSNGYGDREFLLNDIEVDENSESYFFKPIYEIQSDFIKKQIEEKKAKIILVVQSKDSKFYTLNDDSLYIEINKKRISLSKITKFQLLIKATQNISFCDNDDLNTFYNRFKSEIEVSKHNLLGFSNTVGFDARFEKPLELFEKKVDSNLKSDIAIELSNETIIIKYKNENLQFIDSPQSKNLNNVYVYMGLQKALYRFIMENGSDGYIDIDDMEEPTNLLDIKLYKLMKNKKVQTLSFDNVDSVIYLISDKVIEKFSNAVRGLYK